MQYTIFLLHNLYVSAKCHTSPDSLSSENYIHFMLLLNHTIITVYCLQYTYYHALLRYHHTGSVTLSFKDPDIYKKILIHTPTQGVTIMRYLHLFQLLNFNPHSHAGSDGRNAEKRSCILYFNPHSHAGSDSYMDCTGFVPQISIHTPTQGVTKYGPNIPIFDEISIHTPTQGVTIGKDMRNPWRDISIHTPTQGVTLVNFNQLMELGISIHTPTQGVTSVFARTSSRLPYFNPHSHAGSDPGSPSV